MTVLNLTLSWLHFLNDGVMLASKTTDRSPATSIDGDVVNHAGGRQRAYSVEGEARSFPVTFVYITGAQRDLLEQRKGEPVHYRDTRGTSLYATYFATATVYEYDGQDRYSVHVDLRAVTVDEGV